MSKKTISLCLIVKNEQELLPRCIKSFTGAYDELIVVDTGSTDDTILISNRQGAKTYSYLEWNGNFSAARQFSFSKATSEFILWADADDILREGDALKIRKLIDQHTADIYLIPYSANKQLGERERIIRRGCGKWVRPIHERFDPNPGSKTVRNTQILITHGRDNIPEKSHERNLKSLEESTKETPIDLFYLAAEYQRAKRPDLAIKTAQAALCFKHGIHEQYELLLISALSSSEKQAKVQFAMSAYNIIPWRREALVYLCETALEDRRDRDALAFAEAYYGLKKPIEIIWTMQEKWYRWHGHDLYLYCLRRNGLYKDASALEYASRQQKNPLISLIHASRGRTKKMTDIRDLWFDKAHTPKNIEYILAVDSDDKESIEAAKGYPHVILDAGGGCVAAWNAAAQVSNGQVLVQLSDDWIPPKHWDKIILDRIGDKITQEAVLGVSDGIIRENGKITDCMCMAILTRTRYEYQGHMFFNGYKSVFSDNEFTDRAYSDGVVIEARDVVFQHEHPITGKVAMDETYINQNAQERYNAGNATYEARKVPSKELKRDYAVFILATKDDFCLFEVCKRMHEEGAKRIYFGIPDEFWNGTPNTESNKEEVSRVVMQLEKMGVSVYYKYLSVGQFRASDRDILITEAMLRNDLLSKVRSDGFDHVLVVDGDELWIPGTLKMIDNYVSDNNPSSLNCRMVPVVGLPGYPIEGALDGAMIYLGPGCKFSICRSSEGKQNMFPRRQVIHFTATRKTMEEIIQKHRESGHYGDRHYAFEDWIRNTLPNIKPGFKRCHMFIDWDTWPLCREWNNQEWSHIPDIVKPYLGEPK